MLRPAAPIKALTLLHELSASQVSRALAGSSPAVLYTILGICGVAMLYLAFRTSLALVGVLVTCMLMLLFAVYLAQWVMAKDEGTVDMQEVCPLNTSRLAV